MLTTTTDANTTAAAAAAWYRRNRARSEALFDLLDPAVYYTRPIALRNPVVFYEGHLPAFSVIAFLRRGLGRPPVDATLEALFERGIDPESIDAAVPRSGAATAWPSRDEVRAFARKCDDAILAALADFTPTPQAIEGLYTALEHEAMHQETLLYMWHRVPYEMKRRGSMPDSRSPIADERASDGVAATPATVDVAAGDAVLGADRHAVAFGWDNEFDQQTVHVPAFEVDTLPVTNAQFLDFVNDGGYTRRELWTAEGWDWIQADGVSHPAFWLNRDTSSIVHPPSPRSGFGEASPEPALNGARAAAGRPSPIEHWHWRGMFHSEPLPPRRPVYVSHAEASAYAAWKGRRLMTEAEWHRAAEGARPGFVDFGGFDPIDAGSLPDTASAHGVHDLAGNGWEWTSTVFAPFDGFTPMRSYPEYSADFFDGRHYVMKGGSPATARELVRPSFRNWFRGNYPYVYAKFRTARG